MKKLLLSLPILLLSVKIALACSCSPPKGFYDNVSNKSTNGVIRLDSVYLDTPYMKPWAYFTLIKSFNFTDQQDGDTLLLFGQDGINCAVGFYQFNIGDTLVAALSKSGNIYSIPFYGSGCGKHYIMLKNGKHDNLSIEEIEQKILLATSLETPGKTNLKVYPNPVTNAIHFTGDVPDNFSVNIVNAEGKQIHTESLSEGKKEINCTGLAPGIYFIHVRSKHFTQSLKFVKVE